MNGGDVTCGVICNIVCAGLDDQGGAPLGQTDTNGAASYCQLSSKVMARAISDRIYFPQGLAELLYLR